MNIILTSPSALIDKNTNEFFPGIRDVLLNFIKSNPDTNKVVVISQTVHQVAHLMPTEYLLLPSAKKGSVDIITQEIPKFLEKHFGPREYNPINEFFILAGNDKDMQTATNSKLVLLRADYSKINKPEERIFKNSYGIRIKNHKDLESFFNTFIDIENPWYYHLQVSDNTTLFALMDAGTLHKDITPDMKKMAIAFRECFKKGIDSYVNLFTTYFLMAAYHPQFVNEFKEVDFWGIYPSSEVEINENLNIVKEKLRQTFKCPKKDQLFIRHKPSIKRTELTPELRLEQACDNQFETMHINPELKEYLKGRIVCVIDDFTRNGSSLETARHLLEKAGVKKILFVAIGKLGRMPYAKYDYALENDVFSPGYKPIRLRKQASQIDPGIYNNGATAELLEKLGRFVL